jgi:hypothetical protein
MSNLESMTDEQILRAAEVAAKDCNEAGLAERNSEWHECCFAAVVVLSQEMARRGISLNTTH